MLEFNVNNGKEFKFFSFHGIADLRDNYRSGDSEINLLSKSAIVTFCEYNGTLLYFNQLENLLLAFGIEPSISETIRGLYHSYLFYNMSYDKWTGDEIMLDLFMDLRNQLITTLKQISHDYPETDTDIVTYSGKAIYKLKIDYAALIKHTIKDTELNHKEKTAKINTLFEDFKESFDQVFANELSYIYKMLTDRDLVC